MDPSQVRVCASSDKGIETAAIARRTTNLLIDFILASHIDGMPAVFQRLIAIRSAIRCSDDVAVAILIAASERDLEKLSVKEFGNAFRLDSHPGKYEVP